jgi:hypothetical protein
MLPNIFISEQIESPIHLLSIRLTEKGLNIAIEAWVLLD